MAEATTIEARDEAFDEAFAQAAQAAEKGEPLPPAGEDTQPAGAGEDTVKAAAGEDTVKAGAGDDTVKAASGDDTVKAGAGEDTVKAAAGDDTVKAAAGEDTVKAAAGDDTVRAASGQDTVTGAAALDDRTGQPPAKEPPAKTQEQLDAEQRQKEALEKALADYQFTDDEKAAIAIFQKEFPDEFKAVEARLKQIDKIITQRVYNMGQALLEHVEARVAPTIRSAEELAFERHMTLLGNAHADHVALRPQVKAWIAEQPAWLRKPMEETFERGQAQDVIELYTRFKEAKGLNKKDPPTPAGGQPPAKEPEKKESPKPSKDELDALEPVGSKRATPGGKGTPDPNDYDGAWEEALKKK